MSNFNTSNCESVFQAIHQACLDISQYIRNYNSSEGLGVKVGSQNASQDEVKDLDIDLVTSGKMSVKEFLEKAEANIRKGMKDRSFKPKFTLKNHDLVDLLW